MVMHFKIIGKEEIKNDFVVSMSLEKDGTINWVYPFSWSEVEILKIEVRDYITNLKIINDLSPIIEKVSI